jgi:hypothetical protein
MISRVTALVAPLLVLCACGGSGAKSGSTISAGTVSAGDRPASTVTARSTTPPTAASPVAGGNPVNGADFCAFLTAQEPRLAADGSPVGALADLSIEFASWLDTHAAQKPRTAADLDEASQSTCPAMRTKVLTTLGKDSFSSALS